MTRNRMQRTLTIAAIGGFVVASVAGAAPALAAKPSGKGGTTDTTAPSVSIASPAAGSTVSGTVSVNGASSDNVSVKSVAIAIDGGAWTAASGTSSWTYSWATSGLANGSHTLAAKAT